MTAFRKAMVISAAVAVAISLSVFWWSAAPMVTFHDAGEFALAARTGGLPHSPSAPTWTIPATLWVNLLGFQDEPARGTNLFAGFNGALCIGALVILAMMWSRRLRPDAALWNHVAAGAIPGLVLMHSAGYLEQSTATEQYTQMTLLDVMLMILATLMWEAAPGRKRGWLAWGVGLCAGLAIGNHLSQLSLGLPVFLCLCFAAWCQPSAKRDRWMSLVKLNVAAGLGTLTGLLVFLWLPLRSVRQPMMDWGNPETWDLFVKAITRANWDKRLLSEAPAGYLGEWVASYDPLGEFGIIGFLLLGVGLAVMVKQYRRGLVMLITVSVPYAIGMLVAHMGQVELDIVYIRLYGVIDWHIPLYVCGSVTAALAFSALLGRLEERPARIVGAVVLCLLVLGGAAEVRHSTFRNWDVPETFIRKVLEPIPEDCYMICGSDNLSHMLAYWHYARAEKPDRLFYYKVSQFPVPQERNSAEWGWDNIAAYIARSINDYELQPLRFKPAVAERLERKRLFTDFSRQAPSGAERYMLPRGYLLEVMDREVSDEEVLETEAEFNSTHPGYYPERSPDYIPHRLEREAWAYVHAKRGGYFMRRDMVDLAIIEYEKVVDWTPDMPEIWMVLGYNYEKSGNIEEALRCYFSAIENYQFVEGARMSLAIIFAEAGQLEKAEQFLLEELEYVPDNTEARTNLERVRQKMANPE